MIAKYFVAKKEPVITHADGRQVCRNTVAGRREYFARLRVMDLRQHHLCAICGLFMVEPTFDHEAGRGMGGSNRTDAVTDAEGNWINAAVHIWCNTKKGSQRYQWTQFGLYRPVEREAA